MTVLFFVLYLLSGVLLGLAAGRVQSRIDFLAAGLLLYVLVDVIRTAMRL